MRDASRTDQLKHAIQRYLDLMYDGDVTRYERVFRATAQLHGLRDGTMAVLSAAAFKQLIADRPSPPRTVLGNLPGYPSRLSPAGDGGAWLCLFAPRNRLIEFILQEDSYRSAMLTEVEPKFWIAPALSAHQSFLEPLQCGGVTTMGINKAWAPTRSYGLLVRLDRDMQPVTSYHSRANGRRHGITSALEAGGRVIAASRGGNAILALDATAKAEG